MKPPNIGSEFTTQYVGGMFEDHGMHALDLRKWKAERAAIQAANRVKWQRKVKEIEQLSMRRTRLAQGQYRNINFNDEWQMLKDLRRIHATSINAAAAIKIQKVVRGWIARRIIIPFVKKRGEAMRKIKKFLLSVVLRKRGLKLLKERMDRSATIVQKYMRGLQ